MNVLIRLILGLVILFLPVARGWAQPGVDPALGAFIRLEAPVDGTWVMTPGTAELSAVTYDPQGEIRRVEFLAGNAVVGVAEILTRDAVIPGRLRQLSVLWTNPPPGLQAVWARGHDASGTRVESERRHLWVREANSAEIPVVTVTAGQSPAWEQGEISSRRATAVFRRRGGDLSQPLSVLFEIGGTAKLGADYLIPETRVRPSGNWGLLTSMGQVAFAPGAETAVWMIEAVPDSEAEETEQVTVRLDSSQIVIPMIFPPPPPPYQIGSPAEATLEIRDGGATEPSLVVVAPSEGAVFKVGESVLIDTVGQVADSLVTTVEFFANQSKIGESCFLCVVDGIFPPGTPIHNGLTWKPAQPGRYTLTAVGHFGDNRAVRSAPVTVVVEGDSPQPRLTIHQPASGTVVSPREPVQVVAIGVGRFGGITDVELLLDGQRIAESHLAFLRPPEADEAVEHVFEVRIPLGDHELRVRDLNDPNVVSPAVQLRSSLPGEGPKITWVSPANGARFVAGSPIDLDVQARDPDGLLWEVEFFAGERSLGVSRFECPECRLLPGATLAHHLEWKAPPVGRHRLWARAVNAAGEAVISERIEIEVFDGPDGNIAAVRTLPDTLTPGTKFTVRIEVRPAAGVRNYLVEEIPPYIQVTGAPPPPDWPQWRVTAISHDGVLDPFRGAVKFGPFFDAEPRTLTYEIEPDGGPVERAEFEGRVVADGAAVIIGGDRVIEMPRRHPADLDPADNAIGATELTAYGAAWKSGGTWETGPNPIPVDYVTRAATLWRTGERYRFDSAAGEPPLCWVSDAVLPPIPPVDTIPVDAAGRPVFRGVGMRSTVAGEAGSTVTIRVLPSPGTRAYAVEERVPRTPTEISEGGRFDPVTGVLRWGPYLDGAPRRLTYQVAAGADGGDPWGVVSFDGRNERVQNAAPTEPPGPRLVCVEPTAAGAMQVVLEDAELAAGAEFHLEVSHDLRQWHRVSEFTPSHTAGFALDGADSTGKPVFYRAVRVEP